MYPDLPETSSPRTKVAACRGIVALALDEEDHEAAWSFLHRAQVIALKAIAEGTVGDPQRLAREVSVIEEDIRRWTS